MTLSALFSLRSWISRLCRRSRQPIRKTSWRRNSFRPRLELLEQREVPAVSITEFGISTANSGAIDIARGPDGNQWFAEELGHKIAKITLTGVITEYAVAGDAVDVWAGTGTSVWFTEFGANKVGRIDTSTGIITEFTPPTANAGPNGITLGTDGNMWFAEYNVGKIGRITPDGQITEFTVGGRPTDLALGSDGNVWFTSYNTNQIGKISTAGSATYIAAPSGSGPAGIAAGADGNLYVTLYNTGKVAQVTTAGSITQFSIPTANSHPWAINASADGTLWFAESSGNKIAQMTTSGQFQEYAVPTANSSPRGIVAAADGGIWWTEYAANKIGSLTNPTVTVTANDPTASEPGADLGTFQFHRTGDLSSALTITYNTAGSSAGSADYQETLTGSVTFAANQADVFVNLTPLQDDLLEGPETVLLTLQPGLGYFIGSQNAGIVSIADAPFGTISGFLFNDRKGDGQRQSDDSSLAGWTMQLLNEGGQVIANTQTAGDGAYQFTDVTPGAYTVQQVAKTGWTQTAGLVGNVTVHGGGSYSTDFGNFQNLTISGTKFNDQNADGQWQSTETGVADWAIELYTVTDGQLSSVPLQTTTTDQHGDYRFTNLGPLPTGTSYVVIEVQQDGWLQTSPQSSTANTITLPDGRIGHVVSAVSGISLTTASGQTISVSGTGSLTLNRLNNNTQATVTFNDGAGHSGTINTRLTQFEVTYSGGPGTPVSFDTFCIDLAHTVSVGQTYQVDARSDLDAAFSNSGRMAFIFDRFGREDLTNSPIQAAAVQLALWDLSLSTYNPDYNPISFGLDDDGSYSSGDEEIFEVLLGSGPEAALIAALTDEYLRASLGAQTAGGWLDAAAQGEYPGRGQSLLIPGAVYDLGNVNGASVSGHVWYDADAGGFQAYDDYGLAEVTVRLLDPAGSAVSTTVTDVFGFYEFSRVPAGTYQLEFVAPLNHEFIPADTASDDRDSDADPVTGRTSLFSVAVGDVRTDLDAGLVWAGSASIAGQTWFDANANGVRETGEYGLADLPIYLLSADGVRLSATTTSTAGKYEFLELIAGTYQVEIGVPAENGLSPANAAADDADSDADPVTGRTELIVVGDSEAKTDVDAGLIGSGVPGASVGDFVWYDLNANGLQEVDEPGAPGVTVRLLDGAGSVLQATATDLSGRYRFLGLNPALSYRIQFDNPDLGEYDFTQQFAGAPESDSDADQFGYTAFFQAGVPGADKDAGLKKAAHVCDADPAALATVTSKSVPYPQTAFYKGGVTFFWGVALYIDDKGLAELAKAKGGYIVSKRTITWKTGDNAEKSATAWHLNQITLQDGKLVPNNDFSKNAGGQGGPRSMDDGSTSLTYFSVINSPAKGFDPIPFFEKTGKVTVELTWKLYKCPPDAATLAKFPNVGIDQSHIGWDEYVHTKWTDKDPGITVKPLAEGKIDAAVTWTAPNIQSISFTSSNKDIKEGPNREGRPYYKFTNWEYKDGKWQRFVKP